MRIPTLPPHPAVFLESRAALGEYLRGRGVEHSTQPLGVTVHVDLGAIVDYVIDVHWLDDHVRFIAPSALAVPPARLAELALAAEKANAELGLPVWRLLPNLSATDTALLDHNGMLSSRVVEYALGLLREALVRDLPVFRQQLEGATP